MAVERTVLVRLKADPNPFIKGVAEAQAAVKSLTREIDTSNDRTAWLAQGIAALAPAIVPLGAAAVPILSGIATQATFGAAAVGTFALAFIGVGDALKAVNKYQLEPTAANLQKMQETMGKLGPDGQNFVTFLDQVGSQLSVLQMDARSGMFPGMQEGITALLTRLPDVRAIVQEISHAIGELSAEAGKGIASGKFDAFFEFLKRDAEPVLLDMGRTIGNFADGFAAMIVAFEPESMKFSNGLLNMSRSFAEWAHGLESSQSFQDFLNYIDESGPQALAFLEALTHALVGLVKGAAPVGSVVLPLLTDVLDLLGTLANTPVGSFAILTLSLTSLFGRLAALSNLLGSGVAKRAGKGWLGDIANLGSSLKGLVGTSSEVVAATERVTAAQAAQARASVAASNAQAAFERTLAQVTQTQRTWINQMPDATTRLEREYQQQRSLNVLRERAVAADQELAAAERQLAQASEASTAAQVAGWKGVALNAGKVAAPMAGIALATSGITDQFHMTNTVMGASLGLMAGPEMAAAGAAVGALADTVSYFTQRSQAAAQATRDFQATLDDLGNATSQTGQKIIADLGPDLVAKLQSAGVSMKQIIDTVLNGGNKLSNGAPLTAGLQDIQNQLLSIGDIGVSQVPGQLAHPIFDKFSDKATELNHQYRGAVTAAKNAKAAADAFNESVNGSSTAMGGATVAAAQYQAALDAQRQASAKTADQFITLGKDVDNAKVSLDDWIKQLQAQADALTAFGANAAKAADRGLRKGLIAQLQAAGPAGALRMKQLADGTQAQIRRANQAFLSGQRAIKAYIALTVPTKTIDVNTNPALNAVQALYQSLGLIQSKTITITTKSVQSGPGNAANNRKHSGRATGGYISGPGTATSDSIPAYLSNGEYVMKAAAVQKYGVAMFDHMNAMRFASGGLVSRTIIPLTSPVATAHDLGISIDPHGNLKKQLGQFTAALQAAKDKLEQETNARNDLISSITSSLASNDLFGGDTSGGNVFSQTNVGGSIADVFAKLDQQTANANLQTQLEQSLAGRGLSGAAFQTLIQQGGLPALQMFANGTDQQLADYQTKYANRDKAVATTADTTANLFGHTTQAQAHIQSQIDVLTATTQQIQQQMNVRAKQQKEQAKARAKEQAKATATATATALNNTAHRAGRRRR